MKSFIKYHRMPLSLLLMLLCTSNSVYAATTHSISSLKVAYLYNIAKFTEWPEGTWSASSSPFYFCSYGSDDIVEELQALKDKTIAGHKVRLLQPNQEADFQLCNAFYIDTDKRTRYRYLLSLINKKNVLTITDDGSFFDHGGLINLIQKDQRLRFEVSTQELADSQLRLSSKLLQLAILIDSER